MDQFLDGHLSCLVKNRHKLQFVAENIEETGEVQGAAFIIDDIIEDLAKAERKLKEHSKKIGGIFKI